VTTRKHPPLDELEQRPGGERLPYDGSTIDLWSERERWEALGRRVCDLRDRAKREGVPIESLPGARSLIDNFKALGRRLDRRAI
jgi:hypothetical protein